MSEIKKPSEKSRNQQFRKRQQSSSSGSDEDSTFGIEEFKSRSKPSRGLYQSSSGNVKKSEGKLSSSSDEDPQVADDASKAYLSNAFKSTRSGKSAAPVDMGATSIQEIDTQYDRDAQAIRDRIGKSQRAGNDVRSFPYYIGHSHAENAGKQRYGPQRAPQNIRSTTRWDYAPDICKDYKETGTCGFGDSCKFLHDRSDFKFGWQLDAEYEKGLYDDEAGYDYEMADDEQGKEEFPDTCNVCREPFRDPVVTKCEHYFCENCFKSSVAKKNKCPICAMPVDGYAKVAKNILANLANKGGSQIAVI